MAWYDILGPSVPGGQQPAGSSPFAPLGATVPDEVPAGTDYTLHIFFTHPVPVSFGLGAILLNVPNPPGTQLGTPQVSPDGKKADVPVHVGGGGLNPRDLADWIIAVIRAIGAALAAALIGIAAISFVSNNGPQNLGTAAANAAKVAAHATQLASDATKIPSSGGLGGDGGVPWTLIIIGGVLVFLATRR